MSESILDLRVERPLITIDDEKFALRTVDEMNLSEVNQLSKLGKMLESFDPGLDSDQKVAEMEAKLNLAVERLPAPVDPTVDVKPIVESLGMGGKSQILRAAFKRLTTAGSGQEETLAPPKSSPGSSGSMEGTSGDGSTSLTP